MSIAKYMMEGITLSTLINAKPWAHFNGHDAAKRANCVEVVYEEDQKFDYAIRLD